MRLILLTMLAISPCLAQAPPGTAKIAVINGQKAMLSTQEGKKVADRLKAKLEARNKEFETCQVEIAQLEDQFNKGAAVMTGDRKDQLASTINEKKKRYQRDSEDAREETERDQQQAAQSLDDRLSAVIHKFAADNGYTLVIDSSVPGNPVRYASTAIDITADVVALYDKTYGK